MFWWKIKANSKNAKWLHLKSQIKAFYMSKLVFKMPKMVWNFYEMDPLSKIIVRLRSQNANKLKVLEPDLFLDFHSWNEQKTFDLKHSFRHFLVGHVSDMFPFVLGLLQPIPQHACVLTLALGTSDHVTVRWRTLMGRAPATSCRHFWVPSSLGFGPNLFGVSCKIHPESDSKKI